MSRILAVANVKGGVGKTTATVNLAGALIERGRTVLTVDLDPQASLTVYLGPQLDPLSRTIREALDTNATPIVSIVVQTPEGINLVPADHELENTSRELATSKGGLSAVRAALEPLRNRYDYMLLDCPANAGILTSAALAAADGVILPVTLDYVGFKSLEWCLSLIRQIREKANPALTVDGLFYSMADFRTHHTREMISQLQKTYGSEFPIFSTAIRQSVQIKDAAAAGKTILHYAPDSVAAQSYRALAEEIDTGIRKSVDNQIYLVLTEAREAMAQKDIPSAYSAFCRATEINPQLTEAWIGRGESAPAWDEAVRSYARALQLEPLLHPVGASLGKILDEKTASSLPPDIPELLTSAHYLAEMGQTSYAEKLYAAVSELDPGRAEAWLGRARTTKNAKDAVSYLERCLKIDAANPQAQAALASARERLKRESIDLVEDGAKLVREGKRIEAQAMYKQAVELDPSNELGWLGLAHTAEDYGVMRDFARRAFEINPQNSEARELAILLWKPETDRPVSAKRPSSSSGRKWIVVALVIVVVALVVIAVVAALFVFLAVRG